MSTRTDAHAESIIADETATAWASLLTEVTDGAAGNVTESADPGYGRILMEFDAPAGRSAANSNDETWAAATQDNPDIVGVGLHDSEVGGTLKHVVTLDNPVTYLNGYEPKVTAGQVTVTEDAFSG